MSNKSELPEYQKIFWFYVIQWGTMDTGKVNIGHKSCQKLWFFQMFLCIAAFNWEGPLQNMQY